MNNAQHPDPDVKLAHTIATRIARLADEHGSPNNFSLQELDLRATPLELSRICRRRLAWINDALVPLRLVVKYTPRRTEKETGIPGGSPATGAATSVNVCV